MFVEKADILLHRSNQLSRRHALILAQTPQHSRNEPHWSWPVNVYANAQRWDASISVSNDGSQAAVTIEIFHKEYCFATRAPTVLNGPIRNKNYQNSKIRFFYFTHKLMLSNADDHAANLHHPIKPHSLITRVGRISLTNKTTSMSIKHVKPFPTSRIPINDDEPASIGISTIPHSSELYTRQG